MHDLASILVRRLQRHAALSSEETRALQDATSNVQSFNAGDYLVKDGAPVERIFAIVSGMACRYKLLPDGRRQITSYMLPGDLCDTRTFILRRQDHSIAALSRVEASVLSRESVQRLESSPGLSQAFAWNSLVNQSIARQWIINVGQRTAFERLSHLLCELFERLRAVGLTRESSCELPLTQTEIADAVALSAVHVNRTLMELRRSGLVSFHTRQLEIHDLPGLKIAAGFDPEYLHTDLRAS